MIFIYSILEYIIFNLLGFINRKVLDIIFTLALIILLPIKSIFLGDFIVDPLFYLLQSFISYPTAWTFITWLIFHYWIIATKSFFNV